jgi:hypothetical protein
VQCRGDQRGIATGGGELVEVCDAADATAGDDFGLRRALAQFAAEIERGNASVNADGGEVENNETIDADGECLRCTVERGHTEPSVGWRDDFAVAEVEAEDKPVGADNAHESFEGRSIRERFECGNYAIDLCTVVLKVGKGSGGGIGSEPGVSQETYARIKERAISRPVRRCGVLPIADRVEVGDVERVKSETHERSGDFGGVAAGDELALDGAIFAAATGDAADDLTTFEVDDGEDAHGRKLMNGRGLVRLGQTDMRCNLGTDLKSVLQRARYLPALAAAPVPTADSPYSGR